MNKQQLTIAIMATAMWTNGLALIRYNPTQLDQFTSTHQCNHCDLSGAVLNGNYSGSELIASLLDGADLMMTNFSNTDFSQANLNGVDGSHAIFSQAHFNYAELSQSTFTKADFSHADFTGAVVTDAYFPSANFLGATISAAQLASASSICDAILPDGSKGKC